MNHSVLAYFHDQKRNLPIEHCELFFIPRQEEFIWLNGVIWQVVRVEHVITFGQKHSVNIHVYSDL